MDYKFLSNLLGVEIKKLHEWNKTVPEDEKITFGSLIDDIAETPEEYPDFGKEFNNRPIEDKKNDLAKIFFDIMPRLTQELK